MKYYGCLKMLWSTEALTLLETLVSFALTSVMLAAALRLVIVASGVTKQELARSDALYQDMVVRRMLETDVHGAVSIATSDRGITLVEVNGQSVTYWVNGSHQMVRVGSTGGTSVAAAGIRNWQFSIRNGVVEVKLQWTSGLYETLRMNSLAAQGG